MTGSIDAARATFVRDDIVVQLTDAQANQLKGRTNVVLGIRPEHIFITDAISANGIKASVYVTELMGNETLVFLSAGSQRLIARAPADFRAAEESALSLSFAIEKAHFFDPQTEERL